MNKILLLWIPASILLFAMCTNTTEKGRNAKSAVKANEHHDDHDEGLPGVVLNNGMKWQANPETSRGIEKMIKLLDEHNIAGDPIVLQEALRSEYQGIFQKCTMKGEAHVQLHNYLVPLNKKISVLNGPAEIERVNDLKAYLLDYATWFE